MKGISTLPTFLLVLFSSVHLNAQITTASQWTWMKGDNTINTPEVYGTQGIATPANKPGARSGSVSWTDAAGNFWLFGGAPQPSGSGGLNDLWKYNPATNQWAWMKGDMIAYQPGVYGTIGVAAAANKPGARSSSAMWTDAAGNFWLFGGFGRDGGGGGGELSDLWKYNPATNQWTWINGPNVAFQLGVYGTMGVASAANKPGARYSSVSWVDAAGDFWLFGGLGYGASGSSSFLNDLWKYSPSTNQWTWMKGTSTTGQTGVYGTLGTAAPANTPGARYGSSSWTDAAGNLWLFGGSLFNDVWKYSTATNQWTWVKGASTAYAQGVFGTLGTADAANTPSGRQQCFSWMDVAGNFWILGGYSHTPVNAMLNDLWRYNPTTNQWTWMKGSNTAFQQGVYGTMGTAAAANVPGARYSGNSWTDATGNLWLFGGYGYAASGSGFLNDLWKLGAGSTSTPPNLTINDISRNEGNSGTTTYSFTISLDAPAPVGGVAFSVATADGTANAGSDYVAKSLTSQTIAAGSSAYTFDVLVNGDVSVEPDETFFVNVTNVTNATVADGQGQGTIVNDDCTPFAIAPATLPNATQGTTYSQTLIITGGSGTYTTALTGTLPPGVSFSGNTISGTPTATGTYTFTVTVSTTSNCTTPVSKTYTVVVDPVPLPNLTINDVGRNEGNSGTTTYTFMVTLSAPAPASGVSFNIATANGTATAGSDYVAKSLINQSIATGSSTYTFDVQVNGDTANEPNETFLVNITNVSGAVVADGQGLGIIVNDDFVQDSITTASQWTWIKGDSTINVPGVYGTKGIPATTNKPGARRGSATWTDTSGNFWLFGGRGADATNPPNSLLLLNDLWKYAPATNQWTWIGGDSIAGKNGVFGTAGVANATNKPGSRVVSVSWTDAVGNFWLFGGNGFAASGSSSGALNDLWKYTPATNQWVWMKGDSSIEPRATYGVQGVAASANKPGGRYISANWIDDAGNLFLFGGQGYASTVGSFGDYNDLWKYTPGSNQWTWLKGDTIPYQLGVYGVQGSAAITNKPGGRSGSLASKDIDGNIWLFGGSGRGALGATGYLNDLWKYTPATNQWAWMKGDSIINQYGVYGTQGVATAATKPGGKNSGYRWTDAAGNFWLFGGDGYAAGSIGRMSDLWKYNLTTNQWAWMKGDSTADQPSVYGTMGVAGAANKPGGRAIGMTWIDAAGTFWLFAGNNPQQQNDLWKLNTVNVGIVSVGNGNWDNPSTWVGGVVPSAGSAVIVRHAVTVQANASCYSLRVESPGGFVTVTTGVQFTVLH